MIEVTLETFELIMAASVGMRRRIEAIKKGSVNKGADLANAWTIDIEGACGEVACAKARGVYWNGSVNTYKQNDLDGLQIRTSSIPDARLIVRHDDSDDDMFVLVTGVAPRYKVWGWIRGGDAKQPQWLDNPGGRNEAFFVPREALAKFNSED